MNRIATKVIVRIFLPAIVGLAILAGTASCKDSKSYSDLLTEEEHAVNWYLAQQRIVPYVPGDSIFEVGEKAPFYRMDSEGDVYMRVLRAGDMSNRPQKGQRVYFRFTRTDLKAYSAGGGFGEGGNLEDDMSYASWSLIYGNTSLPSTTDLGTGIQIPLNYLGYDCEVDLVVKSRVGPSGDMGQCIPYLYSNLKFFKAEY